MEKTRLRLSCGINGALPGGFLRKYSGGKSQNSLGLREKSPKNRVNREKMGKPHDGKSRD